MTAPPPEDQAEKPPIETLGQLIGTVLAYIAMGAIALVVIDLLFITVAGGGFGRISGWVAAVPSVFVFTEQFRRYEGLSRWVITLIGVVLGLSAGIASTTLLPLTWSPLAVGGVGGLVAALGYSALWYAGIKIYGEERPG